MLLRLHTEEATVDCPVEGALDIDDVQIGSMFVTDELIKAVVGPIQGHRPQLLVDGSPVEERWQTAEIRIDPAQLTRWGRTRLLWAPVLRRVRLRLRRPAPHHTIVAVRRRWPR